MLTAAGVGIGRGDSEGMAHACAGLTWGVCGVVATCAILSLFVLLYCVCCFIICSKSRWCRNRDKRILARRRPCRTVRHLLVSNMLYRCYSSFTMVYTKVALSVSGNIIVNSRVTTSRKHVHGSKRYIGLYKAIYKTLKFKTELYNIRQNYCSYS